MKVVICGGPSCGKTTTLEALKKRGYQVIPEAARDIIEQEVAKGTDIPGLVSSIQFQIDVAQLQVQREQQAKGELVFVDRGVIDNLAYHTFYGLETPEQVLEQAKNRKYSKVFLLEMLPQVEVDAVRTESPEEAKRLETLIEHHYQEMGYRVTRVPVMSVEDRVEFIMENI